MRKNSRLACVNAPRRVGQAGRALESAAARAPDRERFGRDGVPDSDDCGSELDTDRDGIPNCNDEDDDGDGVLTRDVFSVAILGALENPWGIRGSGSECARD